MKFNFKMYKDHKPEPERNEIIMIDNKCERCGKKTTEIYRLSGLRVATEYLCSKCFMNKWREENFQEMPSKYWGIKSLKDLNRMEGIDEIE